MGLDMYLYTNSKKVCKAANKATGDEKWRIARGTAIYWRKANHIHNWFVENVQYGDDDCGLYEVSVEQLMELRDVCQKVIDGSKLVPGKVWNGQRGTKHGWEDTYEDGSVIEDPTVAEELLPTQSGFFFGSTQYDGWYLDDVKTARDGIDAILDNIEQYERHLCGGVTWSDWREKGEPDEWSVTFHYHASW